MSNTALEAGGATETASGAGGGAEICVGSTVAGAAVAPRATHRLQRPPSLPGGSDRLQRLHEDISDGVDVASGQRGAEQAAAYVCERGRQTRKRPALM